MELIRVDLINITHNLWVPDNAKSDKLLSKIDIQRSLILESFVAAVMCDVTKTSDTKQMTFLWKKTLWIVLYWWAFSKKTDWNTSWCQASHWHRDCIIHRFSVWCIWAILMRPYRHKAHFTYTLLVITQQILNGFESEICHQSYSDVICSVDLSIFLLRWRYGL